MSDRKVVADHKLKPLEHIDTGPLGAEIVSAGIFAAVALLLTSWLRRRARTQQPQPRPAARA